MVGLDLGSMYYIPLKGVDMDGEKLEEGQNIDIESFIRRLIHICETRELVRSPAYEGGVDGMLMGRLDRAALNQIDGGDAMLSRYAIWANTCHDYITNAVELLDNGRMVEAKELLVQSANSLTAFVEIQAIFDPFFTDQPSLLDGQVEEVPRGYKPLTDRGVG